MEPLHRIAPLVKQIVLSIDPYEIIGGGFPKLRSCLGLSVFIKVVPFHRLVHVVQQPFRRLQGKPSGDGGSYFGIFDLRLREIPPVLNGIGAGRIRISIHIHPAGLHLSGGIKAVIFSVDPADPVLALLVSGGGAVLLSAGSKIIPVLAVVALRTVGIIVLILVIRRLQVSPASLHSSVAAQIIQIVLCPAGLHHAFGIKQIIPSVDLLPAVLYDLPAVSKIKPDVLIPAVIGTGLYPLIGHHDPVGIHKIILVCPAADRHLSVSV